MVNMPLGIDTINVYMHNLITVCTVCKIKSVTEAGPILSDLSTKPHKYSMYINKHYAIFKIILLFKINKSNCKSQI